MRAALLQPLLRLLTAAGTSPDQITLLAGLVGFAFGPLVLNGFVLTGLIMLLLHVLLVVHGRRQRGLLVMVVPRRGLLLSAAAALPVQVSRVMGRGMRRVPTAVIEPTTVLLLLLLHQIHSVVDCGRGGIKLPRG